MCLLQSCGKDGMLSGLRIQCGRLSSHEGGECSKKENSAQLEADKTIYRPRLCQQHPLNPAGGLSKLGTLKTSLMRILLLQSHPVFQSLPSFVATWAGGCENGQMSRGV